jgi:nucleotide-binding universal stress UspA family protein
MAIRDIFVPLFPEIEFERQLDAAYQLSGRFNAHISVVFIQPDEDAITAAIPEMISTPMLTLETIQRDERPQRLAHAKFEQWRVTHDLALDTGCTQIKCVGWRTETGSVEPLVAAIGRVSDLIILNRPGNDEAATEHAFDTTMFQTACPALLVPGHVPADLTNHVLIAWNGSLEAARAVAGAMPILRAAERVSIVTLARGSEETAHDFDLVEHLSWHGVRAVHLPVCETGSTAATLLDTVMDKNVTLLVMGAYTHSRAQQMLLGGVTRDVIRHSVVPVLMTH